MLLQRNILWEAIPLVDDGVGDNAADSYKPYPLNSFRLVLMQCLHCYCSEKDCSMAAKTVSKLKYISLCL